MSEQEAVDQLVTDLQWQIDEMKPRGIKNSAGNPYNPSHYKRGLNDAIDRGGLEVVEYVRKYLYKPPSQGYKKLEEADSLDLACEWLVMDAEKPYASLFTDADRATARERLGPHIKAIEEAKADHRARIIAVRNEIRAKQGKPRLTEEQLASSSKR